MHSGNGQIQILFLTSLSKAAQRVSRDQAGCELVFSWLGTTSLSSASIGLLSFVGPRELEPWDQEGGKIKLLDIFNGMEPFVKQLSSNP